MTFKFFLAKWEISTILTIEIHLMRDSLCPNFPLPTYTKVTLKRQNVLSYFETTNELYGLTLKTLEVIKCTNEGSQVDNQLEVPSLLLTIYEKLLFFVHFGILLCYYLLSTISKLT